MAEKRINRESIRWLILEGIAVLVSIMLAFTIDAWWDDRKEGRKRAELSYSLRMEFEANREQLVNRIERAISLIEQSDRFMEIPHAKFP